ADMPMFGDSGTALSAPPGSATQILCWLFEGELVKALTAGLASIDGGLSIEQRGQKLTELERELLVLEQQEEHLVVAALAAGLECDRRVSANPIAILGLD